MPVATRRSTSGLARRVGGEPSCSGAASLCRKPARARISSRRSSRHGRCESPASGTKRAFGSRRELAAATDRHGAVAAPVQHERGYIDLRQQRPEIGAEIELEKSDAASALAVVRCMRW
jgi:hypothetical protein